VAGIGPDIKEVMNELGNLAVILRSPTNLTEKITYDVNGQSSNPFMREFALAASLVYDTVIQPGDLLQFNGETYLVVHKTPDDFEGEVVEYAAGFLKCNIPTFSLLSPTTVQDPDTFIITNGWAVKKALGHCLIYHNARGALLNSDSNAGKETTFTLDCFVPASYNAAKFDRIHISGTEYYRVQDVEQYSYPGVHILTLVEDDRVVYTP
jgi:hypothetical protein